MTDNQPLRLAEADREADAEAEDEIEVSSGGSSRP